MSYPNFVLIAEGRSTIDGGGVKLKRILPIFKGYRQVFEINPFLLLDEFKSENEDDYKNGFPLHPHKGFQTITYMKWGSFQHADSLGNQSIIQEGGVQWMIAGSGIQHSEMPINNRDKRIWGYQLWVNLPKKYKYIEPYYKNINKEEIPQLDIEEGSIKILFGKSNYSSVGGVENPYLKFNYFDITIKPKMTLLFDNTVVDFGDWILCYVYWGEIMLTLKNDRLRIKKNQLAVLEHGNKLEIYNPSEEESHFLFLNAEKLNEPLVRYGPFVMNTEAEIIDAIKQFQ